MYKFLFWNKKITLEVLRIDQYCEKFLGMLVTKSFFSVRFGVAIKPKLPEIIKHYEIRNPVFHLPAIKLKFAENLLQYCLIKQINEEHCFSMMLDKVEMTSFYSFKVFTCIKHRVLDTYRSTCEIVKCKACAIINK